MVEGDEDFGRELARALEAQGMVARVIGTGKEALAAAEAARPDLIVLCAELPDVSGYAVCSRLKRNRETAAIPVILTSGCEDTESFWSHQRLWVRAEAYLRKPFDPAPLAVLLAPAATPARAAAPQAPVPAAPQRAAGRVASEEILEDGFEYVGGGDADVLEDGFVYLGGGAEPQALEDGLVQVIAPPPPDEVLEDGFVYLGGGAEPQELDEATVYVTGLEAAVGGAARTAPGRWRLPARLGAAA